MARETITIKGDRNKWLDFTIALKKEGKQVWDVLEPLIDKYIIKNK